MRRSTIAFSFLIAAQLIGTVTYLVFLSRLLARLRAAHAELWESLGRPSLVRDSTMASQARLLGWLRRRGYANAGDPELQRLGAGVRTILISLIANFAVVLLVIVALALRVR